jgi:hypothetical protein
MDIQTDRRQASRYVPRRTAIRVHPVLRSLASRQGENVSMSTKNQKQPDQRRIVASLASQCHLPIGEMATLYEHERAELALSAHITKYLHCSGTKLLAMPGNSICMASRFQPTIWPWLNENTGESPAWSRRRPIPRRACWWPVLR